MLNGCTLVASSAAPSLKLPRRSGCTLRYATIAYIDDDTFVGQPALELWLAEPLHDQQPESVLLTCTEEMHYFRQYNYLKFSAARLQVELKNCVGCIDMLGDLNDMMAAAEQLRNRIVEANLGLVYSVAGKFSATSLAERDDLISVGSEALLCAVEKFDYRRGFRFSTYAYSAIQRAIYGLFRREQRAHKRLSNEGHQQTETAIKDAASADRQLLDVEEARREVAVLLKLLEPREREILMLRFAFDIGRQPASFQAIGQQVGLSKQRVAAIYSSILQKLRRAVGQP